MSMTVLSLLSGLVTETKRKRPLLWFMALTVAAFFGWVAVGYVAGVGC